MIFFKLDPSQLRNFDAALDGNTHTFRTSTGTVLRRLAHHMGWPKALGRLVMACLAQDETAAQLAAGNVTRKQIRLPALFGNRVVSGVYAWVKTTQSSLLRDALAHEMSALQPDISIIFNGSLYPESVLAHVSQGRKRVFVEGGFFPGTLQIDPKGLNAANSVPRDPAFYLDATEDFAAPGLPQAVNDRKSKTTSGGEIDLTPGYVFVPFQVPSDMQVTLHSPWVRNMEMFLDTILAAADRNPDDVFVIKEHPSFKLSVKGLRTDHPRVIFANDNVTSELIQNSRAVITLNSTVGIEGLLFDKPVITLGDACYNIEGLVLHAPDERALDTALIASRDWKHNKKLLSQFIGFLWNKYLVAGRYEDLPEDLADHIRKRV